VVWLGLVFLIAVPFVCPDNPFRVCLFDIQIHLSWEGKGKLGSWQYTHYASLLDTIRNVLRPCVQDRMPV